LADLAAITGGEILTPAELGERLIQRRAVLGRALWPWVLLTSLATMLVAWLRGRRCLE
jgi:hypothetical protein